MIGVLERCLNMLFPTCAFAALFGIIFWGIGKAKKQYSPGLTFLCIAAVFLLGWRFASQLISSRYFALTIFPCVILAAYGIIRLPSAAQWWRSKPELKLYLHGLAAVIMIGMVLAQFFASIHFNPYARDVFPIYDELSRVNHEDNAIILCYYKDIIRIRYYSQTDKVKHIDLFYSAAEREKQDISKFLKQWQDNHQKVYLLNCAPASALFLDEVAENKPQHGKFVRLKSIFTSRKKKTVETLYLFECDLSAATDVIPATGAR